MRLLQLKPGSECGGCRLTRRQRWFGQGRTDGDGLGGHEELQLKIRRTRKAKPSRMAKIGKREHPDLGYEGQKLWA